MRTPRIPTEAQVAELVSVTGEIARGLAFERDQLRELVKAKDEYIACYKLGRRPTESLLERLARLTLLLFPKTKPAAQTDL